MKDEQRPLYPASSTYILKLRRDSAPDRGAWTGRIAHVTSGTQCDFASQEELLTWIACHHARQDLGE